MGYIILADGGGRGPIASRISSDVLEALKGRTGMGMVMQSSSRLEN